MIISEITSHSWQQLKWVVLFEAAGGVAKIGSSLKPYYQIKLLQISGIHDIAFGDILFMLAQAYFSGPWENVFYIIAELNIILLRITIKSDLTLPDQTCLVYTTLTLPWPTFPSP